MIRDLDRSKTAALDRSKFFRHGRDYAILADELQARLSGSGQPYSILDVGIGNGEESLSIMAVANSIARRNGISLDRLVTLRLLDMRPAQQIIVQDGLGKAYMPRGATAAIGLAFTEGMDLSGGELVPVHIPEIQKFPESFELRGGENRFVAPLVRYVQRKVVTSPYIGVNVEEFVAGRAEQYDAIFFNNVLTHLKGDRPAVVRGLLESLRSNGLLFMHSSAHDLDTKGVEGSRKFMAENPEFSYLANAGPAVYRKS